MIIENQRDVTAAVLAELQRASDPRFKEIMTAAVTHLHGFVRDAKLTEVEFHQACSVIATLGQLTTASHNEVVLIAGSLGLSACRPWSACSTTATRARPRPRPT